jgi:tetratricopeptide (TPR) repeat protein
MRFANISASDIQHQVDSAINQFPENEPLLNLAAWYYKDIGNLTYAAELYERLLRINATSALYHARLAVVYVLMERDADALSNARKALELEPNNPYAYYAMGRLFFELGQNEEAADAFQKVPETSPELADAQYYLAVSETRRGHQTRAIEILSKLVQRYPDTFEYQKELGRRLAENGRNMDAIEPLKKAVALKPNNLEALAGLGLAYSEAGKYADGIPILEQAEKLYPGNQVVTMLLGVSRARQRAIPQIPQMKEDAEKDPSNLELRLNLIEILTYADRMAEAEPYIRDLLNTNPKDAQAYRRLTIIYSTVGELDKALEACRKALEIEENPASYLGLASIYTRFGKPDEASKAYAKVIALKPDTPNVMKMYADLLRDNGKRREALDMYKRSLAILPFNGPALYNAGLLSAKLGDGDAAQKYLETLKTVDPVLAKTLRRCLYLKIWQ